MYNHKGVNFTGYPGLPDWEGVLDKLEESEIEESPLGVTLLGVTHEDIKILLATFGRNNGFKVPKKRQEHPIEVHVANMNPVEKPLSRLQHLYRAVFGK